MFFWRISNYGDISGAGAAKYPGRWNTKGLEIVYAAETPALAMLEILIQNSRATLPDTYKLLKIEAPDQMELPDIEGLKNDWQLDEHYTKIVGSRWLTEQTSTLLRVPSVIMPDSFNVLINPHHSDFNKVRIAGVTLNALDPRLK